MPTATKRSKPQPDFRRARIAEIINGPIAGACHLASLHTIADVLALAPTRHALFDRVMTIANLNNLQAEDLLHAIQTRYRAETGKRGPWTEDPAAQSSDPAGQRASRRQPDVQDGHPWRNILLTDLPGLHKSLTDKIKAAGLTVIRSLFDVAATPTYDWNDDTRIACFRWLGAHGFTTHATGHELCEAVRILNAIAAAATPSNGHADRPTTSTAAPSTGRARGGRTPLDVTAAESSGPITDSFPIPIASISVPVNNPRKHFDQAALVDLAATIKTNGLLQSILVRPRPGGITGQYELIAGERRLRAAQIAGLTTISARCADFDDRHADEARLLENDHRADLNPLERAEGYAAFATRHNLSIDDLAKRVHKSPATVYGLLQLPKLPDAAKKAVIANQLPSNTAQLLARIPDSKLRAKATKEILAGQVTIPGNGLYIPDGVMSFRHAKLWIETTYMRQLKGAAFDTKSLTVLPEAGSCTSCPHRTGNITHYTEARADICTNPPCFEKKVAAAAAAQSTAPASPVSRDAQSSERSAAPTSPPPTPASRTRRPATPPNPPAADPDAPHLIESAFGPQIALKLPAWANMIVVCAETPAGLIPDQLLLPHQLYEKTAREIIATHPDATGLIALPVPENSTGQYHCWPLKKSSRSKTSAAKSNGSTNTLPIDPKTGKPDFCSLHRPPKPSPGPAAKSRAARTNKKHEQHNHTGEPAGKLGLTRAELQAAYIADKFTRTPKKPVSVTPFELDGRKWIETGSFRSKRKSSSRILPLYLLADFRAHFKSAGHLSPQDPSHEARGYQADRQRENAYFGTLVSVRGETYAIGHVNEQRIITCTDSADAAKSCVPAGRNHRRK